YTIPALFSLIIFASLVTDGYQNVTTSSQLRCVLNDNWVACSYAITAGVLAFLQSFLFLALDAYDIIITFYDIFQLLYSLKFIWSCIWFVGFCFLANQWNRSAHHYLLGSSSASASIAFAFFSIPCWVRNSHLSFSTPVLSRANTPRILGLFHTKTPPPSYFASSPFFTPDLRCQKESLMPLSLRGAAAAERLLGSGP
uniref:Synaptogyrin 4 n=1 Tax=Gopherus evgoodei TaxID=1825980 RepID=A0A8C4W4Q1_9SAUR